MGGLARGAAVVRGCTPEVHLSFPLEQSLFGGLGGNDCYDVQNMKALISYCATGFNVIGST
jgi:hypothetical protein